MNKDTFHTRWQQHATDEPQIRLRYMSATRDAVDSRQTAVPASPQPYRQSAHRLLRSVARAPNASKTHFSRPRTASGVTMLPYVWKPSPLDGLQPCRTSVTGSQSCSPACTFDHDHEARTHDPWNPAGCPRANSHQLCS